MEDLEYNEDEAVKFIMDHLPAEIKEKVKNDDIEYVLDVIYDFYNERGYLDEADEESDETVDIAENEMFEYIINQVSIDQKSEQLTEDVVDAILDGEYEYCKSIGIFDEEE
jgi:RNA polymerase-binding transcription factor DksA